MPALLQDFRIAVRSLVRRPGFTLVVILTIELGATVFTIVSGVLLKPLPSAVPEELVMIWSHRVGADRTRSFVSRPDIVSLREGMFAKGVEGASPVYVPLT